MSKITLLLAAGAGYVLGARAGTERYEQIKSQATRLWQDPRVQRTANQAQDLVKENAPKVQDKVTDAAGKATAKAKAKVSSSDSHDEPVPVTDGATRIADGPRG